MKLHRERDGVIVSGHVLCPLRATKCGAQMIRCFFIIWGINRLRMDGFLGPLPEVVRIHAVLVGTFNYRDMKTDVLIVNINI